MPLLTRSIQIVMNNNPEPIQYFKEKTGKITHFKKECCFVRFIGVPGGKDQYLQTLKELEADLHVSQAGYLKLNSLAAVTGTDRMDRYIRLYEEVKERWDMREAELAAIVFPYSTGYPEMNLTIKKAFMKTAGLFSRKSGKSDSITKNFAVKLLYWGETYLPEILKRTSDEPAISKVIWVGDIKQQEYLFLYFLHLCGVDILYLNPKEDISQFPEWMKSLSFLHEFPDREEISALMIQEDRQSRPAAAGGRTSSVQPGQHMPGHNAPRQGASRESSPRQSAPVHNTTSEPNKAAAQSTTTPRMAIPPRHNAQRNQSGQSRQQEGLQKLNYEELAGLSGSVVMVKVYNQAGECFATGSGVMINRNGYILTNYHVTKQGAFYGLQIENEDQEYKTRELIKYHAQNDLALIRIDRNTQPLILPPEDALVRGQQIVAIGSPLGLFNTISEGIISGFRYFDDVNIIQFTAPVTHGSSGGALLDLYGRLIGITSGGFGDGLNLNLAVHACEIRNFLRGFI